MKWLNICVANPRHDWRGNHRQHYRRLALDQPGRFAWCTTFDPPDFHDSDYADRVIAELRQDFDAGAVACKVWKNIGMEATDPDGNFVQVDHSVFTPIFEFLCREEVPLVAHIAEPLACWQPLAAGAPHSDYYADNPEWHMHGRSDFPSHTQIIAARDRMLEQYPGLRVVGAHLGSLEYDLSQLAERLDRFPNFAVDMSARLVDLLAKAPSTVRDFFLRYPDRIIFGTDVVMRTPHSTMSPVQRVEANACLRETYDAHFRYFETDALVQHHGQSSPGIALPENVLEGFYLSNARAWYPGL